MKKTIVLVLLLTACSSADVTKKTSPVVSPSPSPTDPDSDSVRKLYDTTIDRWRIIRHDDRLKVAAITIWGKAVGNRSQIVLKITCPAHADYGRGLDFIVRNTHQITDFNFDDFAGPPGIGIRKRLVRVRAISANKTIELRPFITGGYGMGVDPLESDSFTFGMGTDRDIQQVDKLTKSIAAGSFATTFSVRDNRDNRKTIEGTFPSIDPNSDVAKTLKGCR